MVRFGPWSTSLALGMAFGALVAALLWRTRRNREANRLLAGAIVVIVLTLAPYMLGFAGYFDAYPWLSFVPVAYGLCLGPLIYLHVMRLTQASMPSGWGWHLLPGALQALYYAVMFVQPLAVKNAWSRAYDGPWIEPIETVLELVSLSIYLFLANRRYRQYQSWLDGQVSNREEFRLAWLRALLVVLACVVPLWAGFELFGALHDFDYFQRFPLYVGLTVWVLYLGLEGWRHADQVYPVADAPGAPAQLSADTSVPSEQEIPAVDSVERWRRQGEAWQLRLSEAGWWRDPDLGLAELARRLGTNTTYLSRALNEGLGLSFHDLVNRLRVEAVKAALAADPALDDLLALAHDVGFRSKSSFNRQFKRYTGLTPSAYRAARADEVSTHT